MTIVVGTHAVPSSDRKETRTVEIRRAHSGSHAGEMYLSCNCTGGRYSWSGSQFRPCSHVSKVVTLLGVTLIGGHFPASQYPALAVAA